MALDGMTARSVDVVEAVLGAHPEVTTRRIGEQTWLLALPGEVRHAIPVTIDVGDRTCTVTCFVLRGPRHSGALATAALHRVLLRKNAATRRASFCLDADDDVVLRARMPLEEVHAAALEEVLAEVYEMSESAFEALVHLGYPGVFPPLRRAAGSPGASAAGPPTGTAAGEAPPSGPAPPLPGVRLN